MKFPQVPKNESHRLDALNSYQILDTLPEKEYDEITALASMICNTPMSLISLIDKDRQWFKSHHGLDTNETPREFAFCAHAINQKDKTLIVNDARIDERFRDNPLVTGDPNLVFYAGIPLINPEGLPLGTLCVLDVKPKQLTPEQEHALEMLANQLMKLLELRKTTIILHQSNRKLNAKNRTLEKFVSVAAHDIKSPMNNVLALSDMLLEDYSETMDPEAVLLLEHVHTSVLQSTYLIDGILNYSKDPNSLSEHKESVHIKSLLYDIEELLVTKGNVEMTIEVDDNLHAFINKTALHQIFSNLISNSIKYNHQDRVEILVHVYEDDEELKISVKDNGPGIDPKDKKRIFKLFSTTANRDKNGFHGTGIGLATVKNLVHSLGGKIAVISNKKEGANFVFTLKKTWQDVIA
ncbi:sensor histidine kinase [Gelidibacter salicanalis]|uniref:histidine kinase n=1 Tax=Gelidibacter salicanalis TaxID=291193 RepID=A0A934KP82_9FLAO|nr:GAF domain-containing sensor histidine kinase [Gelidibacter salicanalis]MBJ7882952.1 GAF domain-containing sensor histidine kinase [Gelidibacter salicanalis]